MAKSNDEELLDELEMTIVLLIVTVIKELSKRSGELSGSMICPRCNTGIVRWSIASTNGHARVVCDRMVGVREDGESVLCVNAME